MSCKNSKRKDQPGPGERPVLFRMIPPKSGEFSAQGFINALEALNLVNEVLSLELCATDGRVRMYVRSARPDHVLSALRSHYTQARFATVAPEDDPLLMAGDEGAVCRQILWLAGEQWLPFQVRDDTGEDGDPLLSGCVVINGSGDVSDQGSPSAFSCHAWQLQLVPAVEPVLPPHSWRRTLEYSGSDRRHVANAESRGSELPRLRTPTCLLRHSSLRRTNRISGTASFEHSASIRTDSCRFLHVSISHRELRQ